MGRGFPKVFADIVRAQRASKTKGALAASGGQVTLSLEHELRRKSRKGDRIAFFLGFALSVASASFLVYAIDTSAELRKSGLALPKFVAAPMTQNGQGQSPRRLAVQDPESTGALARDPQNTRTTAQKSDVGTPADNELIAYSIRRAFQGFATLEGPAGAIDVVPGSDVPGAGKVVAVRQVAGQWVVETTQGVIRAGSRQAT